jgi:ABC-type lipoprotein export system ATPase subunit
VFIVPFYLVSIPNISKGKKGNICYNLKDIKKYYKVGETTTKALDGVSVAFSKKEFVAILGPSGSGKTTMLNVIGGLDNYDSGDMVINGKSTKDFKNSRLGCLSKQLHWFYLPKL